MKRIVSTLLAGMAIGLAVTSCSGVKNCASPEISVPSEIAAGTGTDTLTIADLDWWEVYGDSRLHDIIEATLTHNKNLLAAAATVEELQHLYRIERAGMYPTLGINVGADHETNDYHNENFKRDPEFDFKGVLAWEADLWGRLRWAKKKGAAQWAASVEDLRAMRMTLIAEAATAYFNLVALDNELAIVRRTTDTRRENMAKAKLRFEGGLTSELVYRQAQAEYASTAALIPNLEGRVKATENVLLLLMGRNPGTMLSRSPDSAMLLGYTNDSIPVGIPSGLLTRRPDLRASEARLKSALADVGVAYSDQFPRLTIGLQGGWENDDLPSLFKSPFTYVIGQLAGPIFDFGRKRSKYKASMAAYNRARLNYEQKVLEVFKEANDAVTAYKKARQSAALKAESRNAALKYMELAELQYRAGSINYIEVLDAQRRYFSAQIDLSNAARDENLSLVRLYKVLGGGWN